MRLRCNPPLCLRLHGHDGQCRPSYRSLPICGAWMPTAKETCGRTAGHRLNHRSRYAMDNEIGRTPPPTHIVLRVAMILGPGVCQHCRGTVYYAHSENSRRERLSPIWREANGQRHECRRSA